MKKNKFILLVFFSLFVFSAYQVYHIFSEYKKGEDSYDNVKKQYRIVIEDEEPASLPADPLTNQLTDNSGIDSFPANEPFSEEAPREFPDYSAHEHPADLSLLQVAFDYILVPQYVFDFNSLLQLNPNVKGWILIDGTHIDYPIVQAADNSYYLRRTVDLTANNAGSIFIDYRNDQPFLQNNTIIYGHNQRNGQMFHDLVLYQQEDYMRKHPYIHIYTPDGHHYLYGIYSVYTANENSRTYSLAFHNDAFFTDYLNFTKENSVIASSVRLNAEDRLLTLSTCTNEHDEDRFVIHARFVTEILGNR